MLLSIVDICDQSGFKFLGENSDGIVTVKAKDQTHLFKKLVTLPFDSTRKCMSVIVRPMFSSEVDADPNQEKTNYLFVKGTVR